MSAIATDANGFSIKSSAVQVVVDPDPVVSVIVPASVDVDQGLTAEANATSGSGGYSFQWLELPPGCANASGPILSCPVLRGSGMAVFQVRITDSNGFLANSVGSSVLVYRDPTILAPVLSITATDVGKQLTGTVQGSGGSGGLTYEWNGLAPGLMGSSENMTGAPTTPGSYSLSVSVRDSNGFETTSTSTELVVNSDPTATVVGNATSLTCNQSLTLVGVGIGGTGSLSYSWVYADGAKASGPMVSHEFTEAGTYRVKLWVNDSVGASANATWVVSVKRPALPPPPPLPAPTVLGVSYGLAEILVALGVFDLLIGVAVGWMMARTRQSLGKSGEEVEGQSNDVRLSK